MDIGAILKSDRSELDDLAKGDWVRVPLHFAAHAGSPVVMGCLLHRTDDAVLVFGEHLALSDSDIVEKMTVLNNELSNMARELRRKERELQEAYDRIRTLSGFLPICSHCKQIRDDQGYWNNLEEYISTHSDAVFSHSLCPECAEQLYPDFFSEPDNGGRSEGFN
jgi:hypothetical protein